MEKKQEFQTKQQKEVILVGAGYSLKEGIDKELWDKIKGKEIWSCNYAYRTMPYLPARELWTDINFFNWNIDELQQLAQKGVPCYAKKNGKYDRIPEINQYKPLPLLYA